MPHIIEYIDANGRNAFKEWMHKIPATHATRVVEALHRISLGNFGDHKAVGEGVMERRIFGSPAIRVYYGMDGRDFVILLAGGTKRGQDKDIAKARRLWGEYRARKAGKSG